MSTLNDPKWIYLAQLTGRERQEQERKGKRGALRAYCFSDRCCATMYKGKLIEGAKRSQVYCNCCGDALFWSRHEQGKRYMKGAGVYYDKHKKGLSNGVQTTN